MYARKFLKDWKWSKTYPEKIWGRLEHFKILTRIYARNLFDAHMILCHESMTLDINFLCVKFGDFMIYGYEDMNDNVKSQNGV